MAHGVQYALTDHQPAGLQSTHTALQQSSFLDLEHYSRSSHESNDGVGLEMVSHLYGAHNNHCVNVQMPIKQPRAMRSNETTLPSISLPNSEEQTSTNLQCFEHGCCGRAFASISNLRRHRKERVREAKTLFCPLCGASFFRKWTRDRHVARLSCKTWSLLPVKCRRMLTRRHLTAS